MDDETLIVAFAAHKTGEPMFTRRMAITLADMVDETPRSLVLRLERLGCLKRGAWDWFVRNGGITPEQIDQVRHENRLTAEGRAADRRSSIVRRPAGAPAAREASQ